MSDETLDTLLEQWRKTHEPDLADEIQRRTAASAPGTPEVLLKLWRGKTTAEGEAAIAALNHLPDDPRMTVMFVKCLYAARWPGSGARSLWTSITERLVSLKDIRALYALRSAAVAPPHFVGIGHTKWVQARLNETADALERACAGRAVPEPSEWFARPGAPTRPKGTVDAVWANPNDDAIRLVVADALLEQGDPWGEFITLGFKIAEGVTAPEVTERAATLLHKHAQVFGGPIAFIARKERWKFEKGFLVSVCAGRSQLPRRRWDEAAVAPHWATVRELALRSSTPVWWLAEVLKNPAAAGIRTIEAFAGELKIQRAEPGAPWRMERLVRRSDLHSWLVNFFRALDDTELARLELGDGITDEDRTEIERARVARATTKPRPRAPAHS